MSTDGWLDREDMADAQNGMLFGLKKEENPAICDNVDEPWGYYAEWKKSGHRRTNAARFLHFLLIHAIGQGLLVAWLPRTLCWKVGLHKAKFPTWACPQGPEIMPILCKGQLEVTFPEPWIQGGSVQSGHGAEKNSLNVLRFLFSLETPCQKPLPPPHPSLPPLPTLPPT